MEATGKKLWIDFKTSWVKSYVCGDTPNWTEKGPCRFSRVFESIFFSIGYIHNKIWEKVKEKAWLKWNDGTLEARRPSPSYLKINWIYRTKSLIWRDAPDGKISEFMGCRGDFKSKLSSELGVDRESALRIKHNCLEVPCRGLWLSDSFGSHLRKRFSFLPGRRKYGLKTKPVFLDHPNPNPWKTTEMNSCEEDPGEQRYAKLCFQTPLTRMQVFFEMGLALYNSAVQAEEDLQSWGFTLSGTTGGTKQGHHWGWCWFFGCYSYKTAFKWV